MKNDLSIRDYLIFISKTNVIKTILSKIILLLAALLFLVYDANATAFPDSLQIISKVKLKTGKIVEGTIKSNLIIRVPLVKKVDSVAHYTANYNFISGKIIESIDEQGILIDTLALPRPLLLMAFNDKTAPDEEELITYAMSKLYTKSKGMQIDFLKDGSFVSLGFPKILSTIIKDEIIGVFGEEKEHSGTTLIIIMENKNGIHKVPVKDLIKFKKKKK